MAVLSDTDRENVKAEFIRELDRIDEEQPAWSKTDLRSAVNAVDAWVSDNQSAYNTALPTTFRDNATAAQKALILLYVVEKRYISGV